MNELVQIARVLPLEEIMMNHSEEYIDRVKTLRIVGAVMRNTQL